MAKTAEEKCLDALKTVMRNRYNDENYIVVGEYAECATCLEKKDGKWEVYHGERLNHYDSQFFTDILTACLTAIEKVGSPDDMSEAKQEFTTLITDTEKYA